MTAEFAAARALERALERSVAGEVRFGAGDRALYSTDGSNYRQVPIGVVVPRSVDDVLAAVACCRDHDAPVLARGGGTSLAGQCCNAAVVLDCSKYLRGIVELDPQARRALVEPGCVLDDLRNRAERHHLTFGPDPATHDHNTLGGMIGNNSCGVHALMAGRTADNVNALDVLTYAGHRLTVGPTPEDELERIIAAGGWRGELYAGLKRIRDRYADEIRARYPRIPRRVSGYNLDELLPERGFNVARALVGTEGTCAIVLGADLALVPSPPCRVLAVLGFTDVYVAADHVPAILEHGPVGLEGLDDVLIEYMQDKQMNEKDLGLLPEGRGWLIVELGGDTREEAEAKARKLVAALERGEAAPHVRVVAEKSEQARIWEIRESGLGATAHLTDRPDNWPGWEDAAVPPARVGAYLRDFRALLDRYGYGCSLYGHFGDGCIHVRIDFELTSRNGIERYKAFTSDAADLVVSYGGSLSGEHGDGQSRADLLPKMYGDELVGAFREFKALWDPNNRMNPGKVVDPYPRDANLRLGADYRAPAIDTVFAYPKDNGSFAGAALRCVGVGKCRHVNTGVMCPSYMATLEEKHSTRGRARLLFEMVRGLNRSDTPLKDGWRSKAVHEALDLCLACKGCLSDCPVDVDMATYKAEFNHRYYKGRLRPRVAYSMGLIYWWSRAASLAPGVVNALARAPVIGGLAKFAAGIAPQRSLPRFATEPFRRMFARRGQRPVGRKVVLWPDTFNNYLEPDNLVAAVEVLEAAGFEPVLPARSLCCARPLYAWGMLDLAKRQLREIMQDLTLPPFAELPVVGLEPACVATFRDELVKLFPHDPRAQGLAKRTFMLGEFLAKESTVAVPKLARKAIVHPHCNQRAVIGLDGERRIMDAMGLDYTVLDSGCCGMAGPFGFEREHYDVSMKIGERVLLPAARAADQDTLIISDGYACREQIAQTTSRSAIHLAVALRLALQENAAASHAPLLVAACAIAGAAAQRGRLSLILDFEIALAGSAALTRPAQARADADAEGREQRERAEQRAAVLRQAPLHTRMPLLRREGALGARCPVHRLVEIAGARSAGLVEHLARDRDLRGAPLRETRHQPARPDRLDGGPADPDLAPRPLGRAHDRVGRHRRVEHRAERLRLAAHERPRPLELRRVERGELDHADRDAAVLCAQLGPHGVREAADRVLRAAVGRLERNRLVGQRRSDLNQHAAVARPHPLQRGVCAVHGAEISVGRDFGEVRGRHLREAAEHGRHRIVDPDVDRSDVALDLVGRGLDRLGVAHVDDASERTVLRELGGRPLDALLVARQHDHARAAPRECARGRIAHARGTTRYYDDLAVRTHRRLMQYPCRPRRNWPKNCISRG